MKKSTLFLAVALLTMCFSSCRRVCCDPPPPSFQMVPASFTFTSIGEKMQLVIVIKHANYQLTDIIWTSGNKNVATVDNKGVVTSVGYGEATITASIEYVTLTCKIIVQSETD